MSARRAHPIGLPSVGESQLIDFKRHCESRTGRSFPDHQAFQEFSTSEFRRFWALFLDWSELLCEGDPEPACTDDRCEQATFFPNLRLSYVENLLRAESDADADRVALLALHDSREPQRITRRQLSEDVRRLARRMRSWGVGAEDRVVALAGNNAEAVVGALASASIGAAFASAGLEMGAPTVLSRFVQLDPKVLMANLEDGGRGELSKRVEDIVRSLPSLQELVILDESPAPDGLRVPAHRLSELLADQAEPPEDEWERFPFNHPLFILFSSGTTGAPKCIVHGAGGTLIEHLKEHRLHVDLRGEDKLLFKTSAGWMMWNWSLSALACGTQVVLYDGRVTGPEGLWSLVDREEVTVFGTSPPFLQMCEDSGFPPNERFALRQLRAVLSTGAVLNDWQFDWVAEQVGRLPLQSISGGTDIIGCFVLGNPDLPVERGKIQCRSLGLDVQAAPIHDSPHDGTVGELICASPFPSRPLGFLGDGGARFHGAYFEQNPGVWTHGDLIEFDEKGQARIHGRSDGVLNIQGVRIGPADIYHALHEVPEVVEAMAVEKRSGREPQLVLLVVLQPGSTLDGRLEIRIRQVIGSQTTPLHVPRLVVAVPALPTTHNDKRSEKAGRDAVNGWEVGNRQALQNPETVAQIRLAVVEKEESARRRGAGPHPLGGTTEQRLLSIWEEMLGVGELRVDDDFFAVGGTSLLALRLISRIERELGAELPLSAMIDAPTVAGLAALIDGSERAFGSLVLLRPGGAAPPLFFAHSLRGDVLEMRRLALELKSDVPVYGLRARGLDPRSDTDTRVEDMAAHYVEAIRAVQPHGPYRVAGYSFGGLVAFEMARLLRLAGEEVGWLGMIDAELHTRCLPLLPRWRHRAAHPFRLVRSGLRHPRSSFSRLARQLILRLAPGAPIGPPPPSEEDAAYTPLLRQMTAICQRAADVYRPSPYAGRATFFLPSVRRLSLYGDPLPVWRRVVRGGLELVTVPGSHLEMASEANVGTLARRVDAHLSA